MSTAPLHDSPPWAKPKPRPTWELVGLFPDQGQWAEDQYLSLPGSRLVELSDGNLEVLPMPTELHQAIVLFLWQTLDAFVRAGELGKVLVAPFSVRLWPGKFREPDVMFMRKENGHRRHQRFWDGADLVMEVLSEDDPNRDLVVKRNEYAQAGIPEYWIVDWRVGRITVLALSGTGSEARYEEHGAFERGARATSATLLGFGAEVDAALSGR